MKLRAVSDREQERFCGPYFLAKEFSLNEIYCFMMINIVI